MQDEIGMAIQFISHNLAVVSEIAHEIIVMYAGRVVERAAADALFAEPLHPYTVGLTRLPASHRDGVAARPGAPDAGSELLPVIPGGVPPGHWVGQQLRCMPAAVFADVLRCASFRAMRAIMTVLRRGWAGATYFAGSEDNQARRAAGAQRRSLERFDAGLNAQSHPTAVPDPVTSVRLTWEDGSARAGPARRSWSVRGLHR